MVTHSGTDCLIEVTFLAPIMMLCTSEPFKDIVKLYLCPSIDLAYILKSVCFLYKLSACHEIGLLFKSRSCESEEPEVVICGELHSQKYL